MTTKTKTPIKFTRIDIEMDESLEDESLEGKLQRTIFAYTFLTLI